MKFLSFFAILSLAFASARAQSDTATRPGELPPVDHMVYLSFLPDVSILTQDAKANGLKAVLLRVKSGDQTQFVALSFART